MKLWQMHKKLRSALFLCIALSRIMVAQRKEVGGATCTYLENMYDVAIEMQQRIYEQNCKRDVHS
jgi:hypothetical protein